MAYGPQDSRIKVDAALEEQIHDATNVEQLKAILREQALAQHLYVPDALNASVLHEVDVAAPRFAKTVEIGGVKHVIEGASELEVEQKLGEFYRTTFQQPAETTEQARNERGQFTAAQGKIDEAEQLEVLAKAELELKFKRGELSTDDYLTQSGAIERHLAEQGVSMESLRDASANQLRASWEQATSEFQQTEEGRRWPGGPENFRKLGNLLQEMGAADFPNAENIRLAVVYLRENNLLEESPDSKISEANSVEEIREALGRSSSFFGRG